jgi:hypothetical protein
MYQQRSAILSLTSEMLANILAFHGAFQPFSWPQAGASSSQPFTSAPGMTTTTGSAKPAQALPTAAGERGQQHAGAVRNLRAGRQRAAEELKTTIYGEHSASYKASN